MEKQKQFKERRFNADVIKTAFDAVKALADPQERLRTTLTLDHHDAQWSYDTVEEFIADYRRFDGYVFCIIEIPTVQLRLQYVNRNFFVTVQAKDRATIESLFDIFERNAEKAKLPANKDPQSAISIFVGHGGSPMWRDLKDHLQDKHGYKVVAYETGARAGHSIRDILEELIKTSSFALLVLTGEDEQRDSTLRARQNVIHEAGLFQGRLGFSRAILLLEEGVELFSNVQGVQYIKFSRGNIKETFGEVLATMRREFGPQDG